MQLAKLGAHSRGQKALETALSSTSNIGIASYGNFIANTTANANDTKPRELNAQPQTSIWSLVKDKGSETLEKSKPRESIWNSVKYNGTAIAETVFPSFYPQMPRLEHALESITETNHQLQKLDPESALYAYDASPIRYNPKTDEFYLAN